MELNDRGTMVPDVQPRVRAQHPLTFAWLPHHLDPVKALLRGAGKAKSPGRLARGGLRSPLNPEACFGDPGLTPQLRLCPKLAR